MSDHETRIKPAITTMVPQLGSDSRRMANGEWDEVKLTYLVGSEQLPNQFKPMLYRLVRRDVVENGKSFDDALCDNMLRLLDAINGRGQNNIIRGENALKGLPVNIEAPPAKPNVLDRLMDRDKVREYEAWKDRQELGITG